MASELSPIGPLAASPGGKTPPNAPGSALFLEFVTFASSFLRYQQAVEKRLRRPFIPRSRRRRRLEGRDAASRLLKVKQPIEILHPEEPRAARRHEECGDQGSFSKACSGAARRLAMGGSLSF